MLYSAVLCCFISVSTQFRITSLVPSVIFNSKSNLEAFFAMSEVLKSASRIGLVYWLLLSINRNLSASFFSALHPPHVLSLSIRIVLIQKARKRLTAFSRSILCSFRAELANASTPCVSFFLAAKVAARM